MLGGSQEEQAKIQTKFQSLMAITIGLQQVQNLLTETSTFRIQTVTKAKQLWTTANRKPRFCSLKMSTASARALTGALTLGLKEVGVVIHLYDKWESETAEGKGGATGVQ